MAAKNSKSLHIAMFPWLAFGHMHPFLDLSKLIAQKGHKISFISTPRNIDRLPHLPPNLSCSISFVKIPLPRLVELPEDAEATADLLDATQMDYLKKAFDGMETELTQFLEESKPDWIIYDFAPHWLPAIAAALGISRVFFSIFNAWFLAFVGPAEPRVRGFDCRGKPEDFMVPPKWIKFDTRLACRRFEADWFVSAFQVNASGYSDTYRYGKVIAGSEAIVVRHSYEFAGEWLDVLAEIHHRQVFPLGLMPPAAQDHSTAETDDKSWISIKDWLDRRDEGSVLYVALGTEVKLNQDQLNELALGLELSGVPFFWALRKASEFDSVELPEGFEERVRGRGLVWKRWVPQLKILSHDSVGGFLTHCGWSSIVEGLTFGRPFVTLPFLVDQGLNSRVVAEKEIGVEILRSEDGSYSGNSVADSVKVVMVDDGGKRLRDKAKEIAALFADRPLHTKYIDNFIHFLENHKG